MRERPILFSGAMVRAILAGAKTQTRRAWRDQPPAGVQVAYVPGETRSPYGQPGDRLWVRETFRGQLDDGSFGYRATHAGPFTWESYTWKPSIHMPRIASRILLEIVSVRVERLQAISPADAQAEGIFFTDYGRECFHSGKGWTDVGDCPAPDEHHPQRPGWAWQPTTSHGQCLISPWHAFGNLWLHVNGCESWAANPWVWCISFKRVEA